MCQEALTPRDIILFLSIVRTAAHIISTHPPPKKHVFLHTEQTLCHSASSHARTVCAPDREHSSALQLHRQT